MAKPKKRVKRKLRIKKSVAIKKKREARSDSVAPFRTVSNDNGAVFKVKIRKKQK